MMQGELEARMHAEMLHRRALAEAAWSMRFGWQRKVRTPGCRAHRRWKARRASGRS